MEDWLEILKEEENKANNKSSSNQDEGDYIELPEPEVIHLNDDGSLQKEITYEYDKDDPNKIYRVERVYYIKDIELRVSESALNRKKTWKKFGQVANVPKGQIERGVTSQRPTSVPFMWTFGNKKSHGNNQQNKPSKPTSIKWTMPRIEEKKNDDNVSVHSSWTSNKSSTGGYKLSKDRISELMGGDPIDIKISNLPLETTWDNIKQLIDAFYRNHLRVRYIPRYKIRMIPSQRTFEEWNSDPIYYKHKLENYERMAIVEFENEKNAQLAIKILNGHRYEYCVLCVEKARPRNNNYSKNYGTANNHKSNGYYSRSR